jgi:DNA repair protein RadC
VFCVLLLDTQHRLLECVELFQGTIDSANVYPREVVKLALTKNAAAVILAHNHPSGVAEPSPSDKLITKALVKALNLVDIRTLDHFVVGKSEWVSFADRGLM